MTLQTITPQFDRGKKSLAYAEQRDADEGVFLQIYSPVDAGELTHKNVMALEVSKWISGSDESWAEVYVEQSLVNGVAHAVRSKWLWDGIGTDVRYGAQFGVFSAVPERKGEFQRVVRNEADGEIQTELLRFSEVGNQVTLIIAKPDTPGAFEIRRLRLRSVSSSAAVA